MNVAIVYGAIVLIWSTTPLGIRFSLESLDFVQALSIRMWLSLLLCVLLLKALSLSLSWTRAAVFGYVAGALAVTGAMLCVYWSAQVLPSGLIAVVWGITPLIVSLYARVWLPNSELDARRILSMVLALIGLYVIFAHSISFGEHMLMALLVLLLGVNLHGVSSIMLQYQQVVKGHSPTHPIVQTTGTLLISAPVYGVLWFALSSPLPEVISTNTVLAVGYLSVFGSILGFIGYFYLMNNMSAANVSLITFLTPVLALFLGAYLADEKLELQTLIGTGCILGALFIYHLQHVRFVLVKMAGFRAKKI